MSNDERKRLVSEWMEIGTYIAAFCRDKDLNYQTFRLWTKQFGDNEPTMADAPLVKLDIP